MSRTKRHDYDSDGRDTRYITTAVAPPVRLVSGKGQGKQHGKNDWNRSPGVEAEPEFSDQVDQVMGDLNPEDDNGQDEEDWEMSQRDEVDHSMGSEHLRKDATSESGGKDSGEEDSLADDVSGIVVGASPRCIGYRETSIVGARGMMVIGAIDVAIPGRGVVTVHRAKFLARSDYSPMDTVDVSGVLVGAVTTRAGWHTSARDLTAEWRAKHGRDATSVELGHLSRLAKRSNDVLSRGNVLAGRPTKNDERDFNTAQNLASFYVTNGRGPDGGDPLTGILGRPETTALINASTSAVPGSSSFFSTITHAVTHNPVTKAVESAASPFLENPVAKAAKAAVSAAVTPILTPMNLAAHVLQGERIDHALLSTLKQDLAAVKTLAPYVQTVLSAIPGPGTGVAGAIAMATALAEGQPVTDAIIAAARGALPGGAAAQFAFDAARAVARGDRIDKAAIEAARNRVPAAYRAAFDAGTALYQGQNLQNIVKTAAPAIASAAHAALVSNVADVAKSLVSSTAGASKMLGMTMKVPGATPQALKAFSDATTVIRKIADAKSAVNTAEDLKKRLGNAVPTVAQRAVLSAGEQGRKLNDAAEKNLRDLAAKAKAGDAKSEAKLKILSVAKDTLQKGEFGHFVTDTGIIRAGRFLPA